MLQHARMRLALLLMLAATTIGCAAETDDEAFEDTEEAVGYSRLGVDTSLPNADGVLSPAVTSAPGGVGGANTAPATGGGSGVDRSTTAARSFR